MSKKSRRKQQRVVHSQMPAKIIFTFPAVRVLKEALILVEESLLRTTEPLPNLVFATETLGGLKVKLDAMLLREEWDRDTPLDYNEMHMLYAAMRMRLVQLAFEKRHADMDLCLVLCKQFSRLVGQIDGKQQPESPDE